MKIFTFLLILSVFFQTAFLPVNLCLILLISRSFAYEESKNYLAAILAGLFLGLLSSINLGFWPIVFLLTVKLVHIIRRLPIAANFLTVIPTSFVIIMLNFYAESLIFGTRINFAKIIWETALTLPFYILVRFWEERFVVKPEMKLKI